MKVYLKVGFFSPSLAAPDECYKLHRIAESEGRSGVCMKYLKKCPLNIGSLLIKHTLPAHVMP